MRTFGVLGQRSGDEQDEPERSDREADALKERAESGQLISRSRSFREPRVTSARRRWQWPTRNSKQEPSQASSDKTDHDEEAAKSTHRQEPMMSAICK